MNYKNIISFISSLNIVKNMTVVLACGSALKKHNPEDVDFIIYTENKQDFSLLFKDKLQNEKIKFVHVFIKKLNVHSIKFEYQGQKLSFLIEDYNSIEAYLKRANDPNVYVDINIFDFQFCYPLIYRKWIIETDYLLGCKKTYESLLNIVKSIRIPKQAIDISKKKILNTIKYLKEISYKTN